MHPDDIESAAPPSIYISSGRVDFLRLIPLTILGLIVALIMAFALLVAEGWLYLYFVTPLILGLSVFGMVWLATKRGRCRNRGIGGFVGLLLAFAYYAGYWELSYLANVVAQGPAMVALTEAVGGLPGLPGYVVFRCKTTRPMKVGDKANNRPPNTFDMVFNGILFGMETFAVVAAATAVGRATAARPYSERLRRWASSFEFSVPSSSAGSLLDAVELADWAQAAALPRISRAAGNNQPSLLVRFEHFPGEREEPVYVTVQGNGGGQKSLIRQREIPEDQADALAVAFPELKLATATEAPAASMLHESLDRLGLSSEPQTHVGVESAKPVDDFRAAAVAASLAILGSRPLPPLAEIPASLCLPASEDGRREMRRTSWAYILTTTLPLLGMFGWLGGLLLLSSAAKGPAGNDTSLSESLAVVGLVGFFVIAAVGLHFWTRGFNAWRSRLVRRVSGRPGASIDAIDDPTSTALALEDGKTFNKMKLLGDDFVLVVFDRASRRIIAEGLTHRYVIRAEDVAACWPLAAVGSVAIRIDYRVGDVVLPVVFAAQDAWSQVAFMTWRSRRMRAEFYARFMAVLDRSSFPDVADHSSTPPQPS